MLVLFWLDGVSDNRHHTIHVLAPMEGGILTAQPA